MFSIKEKWDVKELNLLLWNRYEPERVLAENEQRLVIIIVSLKD